MRGGVGGVMDVTFVGVTLEEGILLDVATVADGTGLA
jgi:hypothetical protein